MIMKKTTIFILLSLISFFFLKTFCQVLPVGLPEDIADYKKWTRLNKKIIPPKEADAHRGFKREYVNRLKNELVDSNKKLTFPFLEGTIVVKEVRKTAKPNSKIVLISIMRKQAGNETTGGWDFVEYTRSSQDGSFIPIPFSKESCYACHSGASDSDAVWTKFDNFKQK
jgi:hypothetical protein